MGRPYVTLFGEIMDIFKPYSKSQAPISTLQKLAQTLSISIDELNEIAALPEDEKYVRKELPKADGSKRALGIPTIKDRIVQMATKIVIEPVFEANFQRVP